MANQNQVNITGRLGQDAEFKAFSNGGGVCNFSVAVSETWTYKNSGQRQEKTEWIPVAMFSKGAEKLTQYLTKGTQVRVCGKFKTRSWENNGAKQYRTEVVVDGFGTEVELLGSPSNSQQSNQGYQQPSQGNQAPNPYAQQVAQNAQGMQGQVDNHMAQNNQNGQGFNNQMSNQGQYGQNGAPKAPNDEPPF